VTDDMGYGAEAYEEADDTASPASVRLGPAPMPKMPRHPWTANLDSYAEEEIAFIHLQLEQMRAEMNMPDAEAHRMAAREELRTNAQPWA
jgi:hypothetical protein